MAPAEPQRRATPGRRFPCGARPDLRPTERTGAAERAHSQRLRGEGGDLARGQRSEQRHPHRPQDTRPVAKAQQRHVHAWRRYQRGGTLQLYPRADDERQGGRSRERVGFKQIELNGVGESPRQAGDPAGALHPADQRRQREAEAGPAFGQGSWYHRRADREPV